MAIDEATHTRHQSHDTSGQPLDRAHERARKQRRVRVLLTVVTPCTTTQGNMGIPCLEASNVTTKFRHFGGGNRGPDSRLLAWANKRVTRNAVCSLLEASPRDEHHVKRKCYTCGTSHYSGASLRALSGDYCFLEARFTHPKKIST